MTEAQLNENIIKNKIKGLCQDCIYLDKIVPIINQMLNEEYVKGLEQGKFDKENKKQQLISFLEDRINESNKVIKQYKKQKEYYDDELYRKEAFQEVLNFVNKGGKKNE